MTTDTRPILGTYFRDTGGARENRPQIALASDEDRAIDLSCRACGALALGAGLGFPVGASAPLRFAPPTSDWSEFQDLPTPPGCLDLPRLAYPYWSEFQDVPTPPGCLDLPRLA